MNRIYIKINLRLVITFILLFVFLKSKAQHCPFDGYSVIVLHFNKKIPEGSTVVLKQPKEQKTDSCLYGTIIYSKPFLSNKDSGFSENTAALRNWYYHGLKNDFDFTKGNLFVFLGDSERYCIQSVNHSNDYEYVSKKNIIEVIMNNKTVLSVQVPDEYIFSICTSSGYWKRIKPFPVKLNK